MRDPSADVRPPRRPGRPPRTTLADLAEAAVDLGLDTFTLRDVATRVGVGPSTAYAYVSGREQLYAEAASSVFERLDTSGDHDRWTDYVDAIAERALDLARAHPGLRDYVLVGPYTDATIAVFDAIIDRVLALVPGLPEHVAWVIASRPVVLTLAFLGDPVLEPMAPWIRTALIDGLDAAIAAGSLPPPPATPWRTKLRPLP